ncbi:MAG: hypothetical protein H6882_04510 [Rhodobiaceae bacterium]|nr:hypothetical protein [Rhodobiaceae bacterium]
MRAELGLDLPERRIGLAAHDVAQHMAGGDAVLTRSLRNEGSPTVASRWLQRLEAVIGKGTPGGPGGARRRTISAGRAIWIIRNKTTRRRNRRPARRSRRGQDASASRRRKR